MTFPELEDELARIKAIANEDEQRDAVFALEDRMAAERNLRILSQVHAAKINADIASYIKRLRDAR